MINMPLLIEFLCLSKLLNSVSFRYLYLKSIQKTVNINNVNGIYLSNEELHFEFIREMYSINNKFNLYEKCLKFNFKHLIIF